ncbi:hypothetical protein QVD17_40683 [Tagetes erecta]|uniref:F-box domain-containing protein n=1 Tax=Tagetes erecta TaxID=13708 RepID=A0AAD8NI24_TARER|nr:hypothetical protein QVD17_40683 [Tagetes erecta]
MNNFTGEQPPIHGDVLEAILSHLPLIHLIPATHVSKSWSTTISSTITSTTAKPWLILHTQTNRPPYTTTTHAYDPQSNSWIQIHNSSINYISTLRSSNSNLLYMISESHLSFSFDPLHLTWHNTVAPKISRLDPIVAVVGTNVIIAGGVHDFENDPLAVEIYDLNSQIWTKSDPMPEFFARSSSSMWLSVASDDHRLFVMDKCSGVTYVFDTSSCNWFGPYDLRPDCSDCCISVIGFIDSKLIVIGVLGEAEDVTGVKVFEVDMNCSSFELTMIGEMPVNLIESFKSDDDSVIESVDVVMAGNMVYMCVCSGGEEVVIVCELVEGGGCRWRRVVSTVAIRRSVVGRLVLTCSMVGMDELQRATQLGNRKFVVKR